MSAPFFGHPVFAILLTKTCTLRLLRKSVCPNTMEADCDCNSQVLGRALHDSCYDEERALSVSGDPE